MAKVERQHFFETGDRVVWHNEIAVVDFPGYRGEDRVRIRLNPHPQPMAMPEYRWIPISDLRQLADGGEGSVDDG